MLKIKNRVAEFKGIVQTVPQTYVKECPFQNKGICKSWGLLVVRPLTSPRVRNFDGKWERGQSYTWKQALRHWIIVGVLPCKTRDACAIVVIDYPHLYATNYCEIPVVTGAGFRRQNCYTVPILFYNPSVPQTRSAHVVFSSAWSRYK